MKIAKEIARKFMNDNAGLTSLHIDVGDMAEALEFDINANLEPIREALKDAVMIEAFVPASSAALRKAKAILAMLSEEE